MFDEFSFAPPIEAGEGGPWNPKQDDYQMPPDEPHGPPLLPASSSPNLRQDYVLSSPLQAMSPATNAPEEDEGLGLSPHEEAPRRHTIATTATTTTTTTVEILAQRFSQLHELHHHHHHHHRDEKDAEPTSVRMPLPPVSPTFLIPATARSHPWPGLEVDELPHVQSLESFLERPEIASPSLSLLPETGPFIMDDLDEKAPEFPVLDTNSPLYRRESRRVLRGARNFELPDETPGPSKQKEPSRPDSNARPPAPAPAPPSPRKPAPSDQDDSIAKMPPIPTSPSGPYRLMEIIEPDEDVDLMPMDLEIDEAYKDIDMDSAADADADAALILSADKVLRSLRGGSGLGSGAGGGNLSFGNLAPGIRKHGLLRYRTAGDMALRCANVVRSTPRMRKRSKNKLRSAAAMSSSLALAAAGHVPPIPIELSMGLLPSPSTPSGIGSPHLATTSCRPSPA
jgi:hypothetical protein